MNEALASVAIFSAEIALASLAGAAVLVYLWRRRQRDLQRQVKELVEKLNANEAERRQKRVQILKEKYGLDDESAQACVSKVAEKEKALYVHILNVVLGRKDRSLDETDQPVEALVDCCCAGPGTTAPTVVAGDDHALSAELERLKKENHKLKTELDKLKEESEHIIHEYVSMYAEADAEEVEGKEGDDSKPSG